MIEFGVLGPLAVRRNGVPVAVPAATLRRLLAVLLCRTGEAVPVAELIEVMWDGTPPANPRKALQVYVHRLRRTLGDDSRISHGAAGYTLLAEPVEIDAVRFADLARLGRVARRAGEPGRASDLYAQGLSLWRGPAYADVTAAPVADEAARLEEQRLLALEDRICADLDLGRHADVVADAAGLANAHPYREQISALLMLALYRSGRQAEALAAFRGTRVVLTEQLGVEPGPALQRLHEAMLRGDERLARLTVDQLNRLGEGVRAQAEVLAATVGTRRPAPPATPMMPVPRQLPADSAGFTGRTPELGALDDLASGTGSVAVIAGSAGVGKTALAVHWAHRISDRFPDGQLYINLHGWAPGSPIRPIEALAQFLRALGATSEQVPVDLGEATAFYRSLLAGRRVLILLDNAASVDQVRPLLPGTTESFALVTSRDRLAGLVAREGAQRLILNVLDEPDAVRLIEAQLGATRVRAEPAAAAELARLCAYLPLALRVAAAHLADRPHVSIAAHVAELRKGDRLAALSVDGDEETTVRAAFDLSYDSVPQPARRLFRLLGLFPGADLTASAAAALARTGAKEAQALLDRLARAHLVAQPSPGRYGLHDLLRLYASELARREDPRDERIAAQQALYAWYIDTINAAGRLLYPQFVRLPGATAHPPAARFASEADALAWLDAELANLVAATRYAATHGLAELAWRLADATRGYFWVRRHAAEWLVAGEAALAAAESANDPEGLAAAHLNLGLAYRSLTQYALSIEHFKMTHAASLEVGWQEAQASALGSLAVAYAELGQTQIALDHLNESLALNRRMGRRAGEAVALGNLSNLMLHLGRLKEAAEHADAAITLSREVGSIGGEAVAMTNRGVILLYLGDVDRAQELLWAALSLYERIGDRYGQSLGLEALARLMLSESRYARAREYAEAALSLTRLTADRGNEAVNLIDLARIHGAVGDDAAALEYGMDALRLARAAASPHPEVEALNALAEIHRKSGRTSEGLTLVREAQALAAERGYRVLAAEALTVEAALHLAAGDRAAAAATAGSARGMHQETGYVRGERDAQAILTEALAATAAP